MQAVDNSEIELLRQRLEEIGSGVLNKRLNRLVEVPDENQGGVGVNLRNAAAESPAM
jgi:hypothetical protein